jgi:hypothetical protein
MLETSVTSASYSRYSVIIALPRVCIQYTESVEVGESVKSTGHHM